MSAPIDPELSRPDRERPGEGSDSELVNAALVASAGGDDFGAWLISRPGQLPDDFELEF